jgi:hypothetical protein
MTVRGRTVEIDGTAGLLLPKPAALVATGCEPGALPVVIDGRAEPPTEPHVVRCSDRRAHLVLVFPLPHTAMLRVLVPLGRSDTLTAEQVPRVPSHDEVVRGWQAQVNRRPRIELPDDRLRMVFESARRDLLLLPTGEDVVSWPDDRVPSPVTARVVEALDLLGCHAEAEPLLHTLADRQRTDGRIASVDDSLASNGALLHALGRHWALTRDRALIEELLGRIAKAGHWIEKRRTARKRPLLHAGTPEDVWWCIKGLEAIAPALVDAGQPEVAEDMWSLGRRLRDDVRRARFVPSGDPDRVVGGLVPDEHGLGWSPSATLDRAIDELRSGDRRALDHLRSVLDHRTPVDTWPEVLSRRTGGGMHGRGHDPAATAGLCTFVREALVVEDRTGLDPADDRLVLCSTVPHEWWGQSWEVHDLPSGLGRLGFAVRWHGDRPALLWELDHRNGGRELTITAPGLDASWSTHSSRGEALLAPVPRPGAGDPPTATGGAEASSSFA